MKNYGIFMKKFKLVSTLTLKVGNLIKKEKNFNGNKYIIVKDMKNRKKIFSKVSKNEDGCWIWTGKVGNSGYGMVPEPSGTFRFTFAHRYFLKCIMERYQKECVYVIGVM